MSKKGKERSGPGISLSVRAWVMWALVAAFWAAGRGLVRLVRRGLFRFRHILGPVWFALAVWAAAALVRSGGPVLWPVWLAGPVLGGLVWFYGDRTGSAVQTVLAKVVPDHLDSGRKGVLDRWTERAYLGGLLAWSGGWAAAYTALGASLPLDIAWWTGLVCFGGPWAIHRRIRRSRLAYRYQARWYRVARSDTVPEADRSKVVRVEGGPAPRLRIKLRPGVTGAHLARKYREIGSILKLRTGAVHITEDKLSERHAWVTLVPADPWKTDLPHPVIMEGSPITSIATEGKWIEMGLKANGRRDGLRLNHILLGGKSGGGKSGFIHSLMVHLTRLTDAVVLAADLAGGATLKVWESCLAWPLATDPAHTVVMLDAVLRLIEHRERVLGKPVDLYDEDTDEQDSFEPSEDYPWVFVVVDELPVLWSAGADALYFWNQILKRGRKCGVWVIAAAQNGTKADTGSKEAQYQFKVLVGLLMDAVASRNFWSSTLDRLGWRSHNLGIGQYLLKDDDHDTPEVRKGWWVSMRDRKRHIRSVAGQAGRLGPEEMNALLDIGHIPEPREPAEAPSAKPAGDDGFDGLVLAELERSGSATEIAKALDCNRSKVIRSLQRMQKLGLTSQNESGRGWHKIESEVA